VSAPDRTPRALIFVGWIAAAGVVALGEASPLRARAPIGPPAGQLAAGLPMLAPEVFPSPPRPAPPVRVAVRPAPPRPARVRLLAEVAAAFAGRDTGAARARRLRLAPENLLPRPLAEFRMAASPLIMPRLSPAPRAVARLPGAARARRARPAEPAGAGAAHGVLPERHDAPRQHGAARDRGGGPAHLPARPPRGALRGRTPPRPLPRGRHRRRRARPAPARSTSTCTTSSAYPLIEAMTTRAEERRLARLAQKGDARPPPSGWSRPTCGSSSRT
jgi:hypothetical protein